MTLKINCVSTCTLSTILHNKHFVFLGGTAQTNLRYVQTKLTSWHKSGNVTQPNLFIVKLAYIPIKKVNISYVGAEQVELV